MTTRASRPAASEAARQVARGLGAFAAWLALALPAPLARGQLFDSQPPYVVTPQRVADRMLAIARVTASDHVIDLGSGDGRIVITAARRHGASGFGVDIRGDLVALSQQSAEREGVAERVRFATQDALQTDLSKASVLTLYLSPELNSQLIPRILETMRPGARIVGHDFAIGTWNPDHTERMDVPEKNHGRGGESTVMLWIVPANAAGRWRATIGSGAVQQTIEFSIAQQFQVIEAAVHTGAGDRRLTLARLTADRIVLELPAAATAVGARIVSARVTGDRMSGHVGAGAAASSGAAFSARRIRSRPDLY